MSDFLDQLTVNDAQALSKVGYELEINDGHVVKMNIPEVLKNA